MKATLNKAKLLQNTANRIDIITEEGVIKIYNKEEHSEIFNVLKHNIESNGIDTTYDITLWLAPTGNESLGVAKLMKITIN